MKNSTPLATVREGGWHREVRDCLFYRTMRLRHPFTGGMLSDALQEELIDQTIDHMDRHWDVYDVKKGPPKKWATFVLYKFIVPKWKAHVMENLDLLDCAIEWVPEADYGEKEDQDLKDEIEVQTDKRTEVIQRAIDRLSTQKQKDVIRLRLFEGMSVADIADHLHTSTCIVYDVYKRAIRNLTKMKLEDHIPLRLLDTGNTSPLTRSLSQKVKGSVSKSLRPNE